MDKTDSANTERLMSARGEGRRPVLGRIRPAWKGRSRKVVFTYSSAFQMQRTPELRFSATLGQEPEVELALV